MTQRKIRALSCLGSELSRESREALLPGRRPRMLRAHATCSVGTRFSRNPRGGRSQPIRRFALQLEEPDLGGWHTVLTAATAETLLVSGRTLVWQKQRLARIVDPEGNVVRVIDPAGTGVSSPNAA